MNVSLTPEHEQLVYRKVASGLYGSPSEVIHEALSLLEDQERTCDMPLDELRAKLDAGIEDIERGRVRRFDDQTVQDIQRRGRERMNKQ